MTRPPPRVPAGPSTFEVAALPIRKPGHQVIRIAATSQVLGKIHRLAPEHMVPTSAELGRRGTHGRAT